MADKKTFVLRISETMYAELESWASQEFRSVNGQIEFILHRAIQERKGTNKKSEETKDEEAA